MIIIWDDLMLVLWTGAKILALLIPLLLAVAYLTYVERKVIAAIQWRRGPNRVGPLGLLQPIADGLKLLHKEIIWPRAANRWIFILAPVATFSLSLMAWAVIPLWAHGALANINVGLLYLLAISGLSVYGIILAGWASNSRYAFLGGLRSAAQMISYEVSIGLIVVAVVLLSGSFNLNDIVAAQKNLWYVVPLFPLMIVYMMSMLAETNRAPFDLPEAEAELVSGYNVEYSSMPFAFFFLGEYANMILMSALGTILFLGGWLSPMGTLDFVPGPLWFVLKMSLFLFVFLWVRAAMPRYRYDQLMYLGWKVFLPFNLFYIIGVAFCILMWGSSL